MIPFYIGINTEKPLPTDLHHQLILIEHAYISDTASYQNDHQLKHQLKQWQTSQINCVLIDEFGTSNQNDLNINDEIDHGMSKLEVEQLRQTYVKDFKDERIYLQQHIYPFQILKLDRLILIQCFKAYYPDTKILGNRPINPYQMRLF